MSERQPPLPVTIALCFAIGFVASFLGIGGGILVIPYLVFGFGLDARRASGTSLGIICVVISCTIAMEYVGGSSKANPAYLAAILIAPTAILAALLMAPLIKKIPQQWLKRVFAIILFTAALKLSGILSGGGPSGWIEYAELGFPFVLILPIFGILVGAVSALVGIGGGLLIIPGLGLLFRDVGPLDARATSILVVLPTALVGFLRHTMQGTAVPRIVRRCGPPCAVGAICGSLVVKSIDAEWFPKVFAAFLVIAGLRLLLTKPRAAD